MRSRTVMPRVIVIGRLHSARRYGAAERRPLDCGAQFSSRPSGPLAADGPHADIRAAPHRGLSRPLRPIDREHGRRAFVEEINSHQEASEPPLRRSWPAAMPRSRHCHDRARARRFKPAQPIRGVFTDQHIFLNPRYRARGAAMDCPPDVAACDLLLQRTCPTTAKQQ